MTFLIFIFPIFADLIWPKNFYWKAEIQAFSSAYFLIHERNLTFLIFQRDVWPQMTSYDLMSSIFENFESWPSFSFDSLCLNFDLKFTKTTSSDLTLFDLLTNDIYAKSYILNRNFWETDNILFLTFTI